MHIAVAFVMLHNLDNVEVSVNPEQVTSITRTKDSEGKKLLTDRVRCVIGLANGKFISVLEECDEVIRRFVGNPP